MSRAWERKKCKICGREFVAVNWCNVYCSDECRKIGVRKNEEAKKRSEHPNEEIVRIAIKARAAGMSYGQYVAQQEYGRI